MVISCKKPVRPIPRTLRATHGTLIEQRLKEGLSAKSIWEELTKQHKYKCAYKTVVLEVRRTIKEALAKGTLVGRATRNCTPHRNFIEAQLRQGQEVRSILAELEKKGFTGGYQALTKFVRTLSHIPIKPEQYQKFAGHNCAQFRDVIDGKLQAGKPAIEIYEDLRKEFGFEGSYSAVRWWTMQLRHPQAPRVARVRHSCCEKHKAIIEELLSKGVSAPEIYRILRESHGYKNSCASLKRFIAKDLGRVLEKQSCCEPYRAIIESLYSGGERVVNIFETLKRDHGYRKSYASVKAFIRRNFGLRRTDK